MWNHTTGSRKKLHSGELTVSGDQWPLFLYQGYAYNLEDPWNGLFKCTLLVYVCISFQIWLPFIYIWLISGLPAHFHLTELCQKRAQGHQIWECPHSWNGKCNTSIDCLCCHTGMWSRIPASTQIYILTPKPNRFTSAYLHLPYFPGLTPSPIQRGSTTPLLDYLMI